MSEVKKNSGSRKKGIPSTVWNTAFVVVRNAQGDVLVDNSLRHFSSQIEREATLDDAISMMEIALDEFRKDRAKRDLTEMSRVGQFHIEPRYVMR